jgi:uncharacterized repeat protein (TIGR01451 family)
VDIWGDAIVASALQKDSDLPQTGAAYVFNRNQGGVNAWGEAAKLTALDAEGRDRFSSSVAISGDTIVVGAMWEDEGGFDADAAYVSQKMMGGDDQWGLTTRLTTSDAQAQDYFGISVATSGDVIVVGAMYEDDGGDCAGAAYVFHRLQNGTNAWGEVTKMIASDTQEDSMLGISVDVSNDVIVVGANKEDSAVENAGGAYVFQTKVSHADLILTMTGHEYPIIGRWPVTYTLNVSNAGPDTAENLTVVNTLPNGVNFQNVTSDGWACSKNVGIITCTWDSLESGEASGISIAVETTSVLGLLINRAAVFAETPDPNMSNNTDEYHLRVREYYYLLTLIYKQKTLPLFLALLPEREEVVCRGLRNCDKPLELSQSSIHRKR